MPFASGSVSFRRLKVQATKQTFKTVDQELIDMALPHLFKERDLGVPEEVEYGWVGGRHILDGQITFEHNVFAEALHMGLRVDVNKVPGATKRAYTALEEAAVAANNPSGFISKIQKRDVKDTVRRKIDDELRSGKHMRQKMSPLLWDVPRGVMYCSAGGPTLEKIQEISERTWGVNLLTLGSGAMIADYCNRNKLAGDIYDGLKPTRFVMGAEGENSYPEYPWVAKSKDPKDFVGNEFLLWLWYTSDMASGTIEGTKVTVMIDRSLELDCAYGQSGKESLVGDGPSKSPEAKIGLRSGKMPRKAGFVMDTGSLQFSFKLLAETMSFGSVKLPEVEEAETARVLFEERVNLLAEFTAGVDAIFDRFCADRVNPTTWKSTTTRIGAWIGKGK